jgi:hypothetical protein
MERPYGSGGAEKRRGTKHFAPGAKVYVYDFFWGVGGESVTVMGRHRKSRRFIQLSMPAKHLANWRAELAYSPAVAKVIRENAEFGSLDAGSERAHRHAEEIAARYMKDGAVSDAEKVTASVTISGQQDHQRFNLNACPHLAASPHADNGMQVTGQP